VVYRKAFLRIVRYIPPVDTSTGGSEGMNPQMAAQGGARRKVSPFSILLSVMVVVILVLSVTALLFARQAEDYHDSKYKAQFVLVDAIVSGTPLATDSIEQMLDSELDNGYRRSAAKFSQATLEAVADACYGIQVMYPSEQDQSMTFRALKVAFSALANATEDGYVQLTDPTPELSTELRASLVSAIPIATGIATLVSAGIDPEADWMECPYDLLSGMDLEALTEQADALMAVL
jgi:hypothetical protein